MRREKVQQAGRQPRITTTARQDFYSYHANRQTAPQNTTARQSSPVQSTSSRWTGQRLLTLSIVLIVGLCLGYTTTLTTNPKVVVATAGQADTLRPVTTYQQKAEELFSESILSRTKMTIDTAKLSQEVQTAFPELTNVQITLPLMGHRPTVQAIGETPSALLAARSGVYVLGESGRALVKVSDIKGAGGLDLPTIRDEADLDVKVGQAILTKQDVAYITTITKQFAAQKTVIDSITLPALASELHVRIAGQPYFIKFSLLTDARVTYGQYAALKKKLEADGVTPKEYIDSRVEERVYYR